MAVGRSLIKLLPALFLLNVMFAEAAKQYPLHITVLSAEFHPLNSGTPVPKDCDLTNFSAYCNESKTPTVQNIMRVRDAEGESFSIVCTVDSRWSRCASLPVGETFEARKDKHGITVLLRNAKGKEKKELFQVVAAAAEPRPDTAVKAQPVVPPSTSPAPAPAAQSAAAAEPQPVAPPPVLATQSASGASASTTLPAATEKVRCNFTSSPPGAEITLDGKYVGNTPSEIAVNAGTHVVAFSTPGFIQWKRDLTVEAGSIVVNVTASLQKSQP
ncbi:MAG: PEGA domain-containing protein [Candidatus Sulfotelmatobacter sp.]